MVAGTEGESRYRRRGGREPLAVVRVLDRGVYVLFAGRADRARHDRDRKRYRAADLRVGFDRYLARAYALSWLVGLWVGTLVAVGGLAVPADLLARVASVGSRGRRPRPSADAPCSSD